MRYPILRRLAGVRYALALSDSLQAWALRMDILATEATGRLRNRCAGWAELQKQHYFFAFVGDVEDCHCLDVLIIL